VGLGLADGKLLWQVPFAARYNTATPIIDGQAVIYSGQGTGTVAFAVEKQGGGFATRQLWKKGQAASQFNTPVLKDGLLFGLSSGKTFFCMSAKTGAVLWTDAARRGECGAVLDAGPALVALTSDSELVAFRPSDQGYMELAHYKVAETPTWAYPILAGNRIFVRDRDSVTLWMLE
jgi:outer membrane protein assembly factor BamB